MELIDTRGWKEYRIYEIFQTEKQGQTVQVPTGAMISKKQLTDGSTPRVTVSNYNNGITGNFISVSFLGTVFYQQKRASLDMKVHCLKPLNIELNEYIAGFLVTVIRKSISNFIYSDQLSSTVLPRLILKLPVNNDGKPDFEYMDAYMRKIVEESEASLESLRRADKSKTVVETGEWREFWLRDLFDFKLPQGDLQVKKVEDGDIPLITPSAFNNGLLQRISSESKSTLFPANTLTVDMFGNAYYQEEDYYVTAHGHVNVLLPKVEINKNNGMFIATAIRSMFLKKYGFSEMCTQKVLKSEKVRLPVLINGNPDWDYIDKYMERIMAESDSTLENLSVFNRENS